VAVGRGLVSDPQLPAQVIRGVERALQAATAGGAIAFNLYVPMGSRLYIA